MQPDQPFPADTRALLEEKARYYNRPAFIDDDPVSIPHRYAGKEDREVSGFFAATIAWGHRRSIIADARRLMLLMDDAPHAFVVHHSDTERRRLTRFVHRTFNGADCMYYVRALRNIYRRHGGLEKVFTGFFAGCADPALPIHRFRTLFFSLPHAARVEKHLGDPLRQSAAKRTCMFLRWMVRQDRQGVDFGLWRGIRPDQLAIPLDVHTGRVARALGLLHRKSDDWKAVAELTQALRHFDPDDPVRFDFALFGLGVNEGFS